MTPPPPLSAAPRPAGPRLEVDTAHAAPRRAPRWVRRPHEQAWLLRLSDYYASLTRRDRTRFEITTCLFGPLVVGYLVYLPLALLLPQVLSVWFWVLLIALLATALTIAAECARAMRFPEPPYAGEVPDAQLPRLALVIAAYLPNEADTILASLRAHLAMDYPADRLLVLCAYNTPTELPVEADLARLAASDARFLSLRVHGSTSKVENVNAALDELRGLVDVIGIFDADHHPHPSSGRRVARWLGDVAGDQRFDVVQGQCVVRNRDETFVTRTVAAEFATIYAVAHPGRTVFNDFGIFGGSNGWWRAETLQTIGLDPDMLTEDIDSSIRALAAGHRLGTDPRILSTELAPTTWSSLWHQRIRWAQGWHQVTLRHTRTLLGSHTINNAQRRGVALLLGWRVLHPWIATQMIPLVLARITPPHHPAVHWTLLFFVMTSGATNAVPFLQSFTANRVAPPGVRHRPWLFTRYGVLCVLFYSELKALTTRAAVVRELLGAHDWDITARSATPAAPRTPRDEIGIAA